MTRFYTEKGLRAKQNKKKKLKKTMAKRAAQKTS